MSVWLNTAMNTEANRPRARAAAPVAEAGDVCLKPHGTAAIFDRLSRSEDSGSRFATSGYANTAIEPNKMTLAKAYATSSPRARVTVLAAMMAEAPRR